MLTLLIATSTKSYTEHPYHYYPTYNITNVQGHSF